MKIAANLMAVLTLIALSLASAESFGKDMNHRLGIGIKDDFSQELPSLAMSYYPNNDIGVTGAIGADTQNSNSKLGLEGGVRKIFIRENNLNFYYGGQLGIVNYQTNNQTQSGFELSALFGAEFYFTGLDSLAFTVEGGAQLVSLNNTRFRTMADSPFRAGIIFYF